MFRAPRPVPRALPLLVGVIALLWLGLPDARAEDTKVWIGVRTGAVFFNDSDPQPLEDLATALSVPEGTGRVVDFEDKPWEIPIGLRVGFVLSKSVNLYGMFERLPYLLETPVGSSPSGGLTPPSDTIRMEAPANLFGAGIDFRLGSDGYGESVLVGFAVGAFDVEGKDQDLTGIQNLYLEASGSFFEVTLATELEFTEELSFYPFGTYRVMKTDSSSARDTRSPEQFDIPDFEIDYTGFTVGMEIRFRLYPWGDGRTEPSDPREG